MTGITGKKIVGLREKQGGKMSRQVAVRCLALQELHTALLPTAGAGAAAAVLV